MWAQTAVPLPIAQKLKATGCNPVALHLYESGDRRLAVIVSNDPSGLNGAIETHASISASVCGFRLRPTAEDVRLTVERLNLKQHTVDAKPGANVVHIWASK